MQPFKPHQPCSRLSITHQQIRHATLIRRPKRPYTFTQLVVLSDGSTFTHRTTSPVPVYKSRKDSRNTLLFNPSSQNELKSRAEEARPLRAFKEKYGMGWEAGAGHEKNERGETADAGRGRGRSGGQKGGVAGAKGGEDNLLDLIGGYGREAEAKNEASGVRAEKERSGKGKGGER